MVLIRMLEQVNALVVSRYLWDKTLRGRLRWMTSKSVRPPPEKATQLAPLGGVRGSVSRDRFEQSGTVPEVHAVHLDEDVLDCP